MTWETAMGVIALFGFVITCATVTSKIAAAMGEFKSAVADLKEALAEFRCSAHDTHDKLFGKIEEQAFRINDHETRIKLLENNNQSVKSVKSVKSAKAAKAERNDGNDRE